jgi:hypothetical protein
MRDFLPYSSFSYTTKSKTRACALLQLLSRLLTINIIKLKNNKHFSTINYKVHVCILHISVLTVVSIAWWYF